MTLNPQNNKSGCAALIQRYGLDHDERGASLPVPTARFYTGFTECKPECQWIPEGFVLVDGWSNGFRVVYVNHAERAILTYCEGDLDMTIDGTPEQFERRLASAKEFYANY